MTRMYGPAVRCKRFSSSWHSAVLHQGIRSLIGADLLRTIMDISARAISLADRPQWASRATPHEALPCLRKPVSSITRTASSSAKCSMT